MTGALRIGCSGYNYDGWRGRFYPEGVPKKKWFEHYAGEFDTVEINKTFYNLPDTSTFDGWHDQAPGGFRYALKLNRYGTHMKKLKDAGEWVPNFTERAERLKTFLGPTLAQLPPNWSFDADRLRRFLDAWPRRLDLAVEMRDRSWLTAEAYDLLADHGVALVWHDLLADHPEVTTADFAYLRFHGPDPDHPYGGAYSEEAIVSAADRIKTHLGGGRDVWVYFNNDQEAQAPEDARRLREAVQG